MNDRMEAYQRGELPLDEARAFEAEVARANATPEGGVVSEADAGREVRDAWRALDTIEGKVALRRRREQRWVVPTMVFAAAAVALLVAWLAWPRSVPVRVAPVPVPQIAIVDTHDEPDASLEIGQVVAAEVVPEAPPEETGSAVDVAKDLVSDLVSDLVIDLATSPLGRGAEWRKQRVPRKGAQELATITVRANPQMALLAASDLLDTIVRCVDDSGPEPGRYQLVLDTLKDHRRVTMRGGTALGRCVLAYDVDSAGGDSLWRQMDAPQATFVLVLETTEAPPMQKIFPGKKAPKLEHDKKPGGKQR